MSGSSLQGHRLRRVADAFASMPERYLGGDARRSEVVQIRIADLGRAWEVTIDGDRCRVHTSIARKPDVVIGTDSATWLALREGRLSGLDAFSNRSLWARGDIDAAVGFEGLFRLPDDRPPLLRMHDVRVEEARISSLTAIGGVEHAIVIHGLGGAKSSMYETVAALSPDYTVHAIDLPGFGASSKPSRAPYDAAFFAKAVLGFMDTLAIDRAHIVGNSMGGRVALEVGLRAPNRVSTLALLAPSMAWLRGRGWAPAVRLLRPELALIPHPMSSEQVRKRFWRMIASPDRIDPAVGDIAADEFVRTYRDRGARVAFYKAARNIYLEDPEGPQGFWTRLEDLKPRSLFIWGSRDWLVPDSFSRHVATRLPDADQVVLTDCGHVPQLEMPERTHELIREFIGAPIAETGAELRQISEQAQRRRA